MGLKPKYRYDAVAQAFHWLIVFLILTQFTLAFIFSDMPLGMDKINLIIVHKAIGMTILLLAIARLVWRFLNPPPGLPDSLKIYERWLAGITHWGLYVLLFALPLSGWLMSSVANIPVEYFGLFDFPSIARADKTLIPATKVAHKVLVIMLIILLVIHIMAVIKHQFILKDDTLSRMLPKFLIGK